MSTVVFVHAHPDDESSQTSGSMARAVKEGHRVVLVVATNGDHGDAPGDLADGETVVDRRRAEAEAAAAVIGTHRIEWLGYADSGMTGWSQNEHESSFFTADTEVAAERVAAVLREEDADVVVGYDWHGGYGHPDHVKVHAVTKRAAELAGTPRYLEASMNRDAMVRGFEAAREAGMDVGDWDPSQAMDDGNPLGSSESELHWACDVSDYLAVKREALKAHASQGDAQGMLSMPEQMFAQGFSWEHFIEPGRPDGMVAGWFLDE
ncbi:GlcNAc-PI de-N-acetylase [Humibacillus sp. DSM 29435]|uniref:PIG-L family deacetylase n=1 Tax=Humibacillus sp. DSM 29435 TaxID=1869167 RepID=UPI000872CAA4|nr:PIG-L family deacetylase [Humibacillus sp. DSM 29435]OFE18823.1 GlcNAc-PI de-N-acetylase [Humibacillus sp. DSM 29435]